MRAPSVPGLREITVHAQRLKPFRKPMVHQPAVKVLSEQPSTFAVLCATSLYVVDGQKFQDVATTAAAFSAIVAEDFQSKREPRPEVVLMVSFRVQFSESTQQSRPVLRVRFFLTAVVRLLRRPDPRWVLCPILPLRRRVSFLPRNRHAHFLGDHDPRQVQKPE